MSDAFDVVVLGAGPAGENAAGRCADNGLSVAIVERELVGGECAYWGCIPSKTLIRPGDAVAAARRVPGAREAVTGELDAAAAFAQRDALVSSWNDEGQLPWLEEKGIELVRGHGRLAGEKRVDVEAKDGSMRTLAARKAVVIAAGTRALIPPIAGVEEVEPWDNRTATATRTVPQSLLVLGGGAVGAELAQAFRRLGTARVTVVEGGPRLLAREEPFAGDEVAEAFRAEGMDVILNARATGARRAGEVELSLEDGRTLRAQELLVAVGRRSATDDLGLETVGLEPGTPVEVDDRLRAPGFDWLYAVGDVNGRALLTHVGKYQGRIAGDVIAGKDARAVDVVPRITFTDPQVAAVGPTEAQAREQGLRVRAVTYPTGGVSGAAVEGEGIAGTSKLVVDEGRRIVVGATFTGPGVQELLHSATVAIVGEVPLERLWHAVPSFPTVSEVWLRLLEEYGL
jgi:pyruvate/2-oxoglutarate dehydrogenase complex dihydrolipoamide dehydrogenase (E3) component